MGEAELAPGACGTPTGGTCHPLFPYTRMGACKGCQVPGRGDLQAQTPWMRVSDRRIPGCYAINGPVIAISLVRASALPDSRNRGTDAREEPLRPSTVKLSRSSFIDVAGNFHTVTVTYYGNLYNENLHLWR